MDRLEAFAKFHVSSLVDDEDAARIHTWRSIKAFPWEPGNDVDDYSATAEMFDEVEEEHVVVTENDIDIKLVDESNSGCQPPMAVLS